MGVIKLEKQRLVWKFDGETMVIEPWGENSLRVRAVANGEIPSLDYALIETPAQQVQLEEGEYEQGRYASITNGKIKAVLREDAWTKRATVSYYNQHGKLLLKEIEAGGALDLYPRKFKAIKGGDYELTVSLESDSQEKLFGMGQYQQEVMDLKYCNFELGHRNSQASIPFVMSSAGYGFLWHNPANGSVSFGKNRTEWYARSTKLMDYWITAGDTPAQMEEAYAAVTGTVPMMPEYGLGFWQCKLRYYNQEQLLEVAREYKRRGLPIDVIVCDFFHWPRMGDFRFDEKFFPDPKAMVDELKELGIELMVSVWPQVDVRSENYEEMKQNGYLMQVESGLHVNMEFGGYSIFYDATNPEARQYVWEKCKKNYYDHGIRLFWLDEAEPELKHYDFDQYRYFAGSSVQVGNIYPQKFSQTFYEGMTQAGQENVVNLVRCAWAGSQRYGALVWSGDVHSTFADFRKQICAGLHMGICGIPWWTTDIGGFALGDPSSEAFRELLVRWFQWGTFCPVMRLHGDRLPQTQIIGSDGQPAVPTGADNEVWSYGESVYEILVKYMGYREEMRDYTRSLMQEAHEKGTPVMRTMFYEFPEDEKCWEVKEQYMYGPRLLVAPVAYENMRKRSVYLPKGAVWKDLNSGNTHEGGQVITVPAPLEVIPLFEREKGMRL